MARGAFGSAVLYRGKGEQLMRGRCLKPHNPKTIRQLLHRTKVANCYKFTSLLPRDLLVGAYDDARRGENWQQAFLRHNVATAPRLTKDKTHDSTAAAFGRWQLSEGPLPNLKMQMFTERGHDENQFVGYVCLNPIIFMQVGAFSSHMIAREGYLKGDVLTFVIYKCGPQRSTREPGYQLMNQKPWVSMFSLRIDPSSTQSMADVLPQALLHSFVDQDGRQRLLIGAMAYGVTTAAFSIIACRRSGKGYAHSSSRLEWAGSVESDWQRFEDPDYINLVLETWGVSRSALLTGGLLS